MSTATQEYRVLGTSPVRHDGVDKVTGRANYGADFTLPGLLHGKVLRSPHAHALIDSIDTSRAVALPGVLAVVIGSDFLDVDSDAARNVIARDRVLYHGHTVAAVAAITGQLAAEALALIDVTYQVLPYVTDLREAMWPDAPQVGGGPNVAPVDVFERGDLDAGFAAAAVVVEREYDSASVHQGYIEPHACVARALEDEQVLLWCSSQGHFNIRTQCADVLGMPASTIRAIPAEIGGGFGGKLKAYLEPLAIRLSQRSGRPVKMVMTREEEFHATGPAPGSYVRLKLGVSSDGSVTAVDCELWFESGAFSGGPAGAGMSAITACYDVPNLRVAGYHVRVNKPKTAAYRAPAAPNGAHAIESALDEVAEQLSIDPLELRLKNAAQEGTRQAAGPAYPVIGMVDVVEAARAHDHYRAPLGEPASGCRRGRGVACGWWGGGAGMATAHISILPDGCPALMTGRPDIGGSRVAHAMVLAEEMGIDVNTVKPFIGDTDATGQNGNTAGSSTAYSASVAVCEAAATLKRELCERAAAIWDVTASEVSWHDGAAHGGGETLTLGELATYASQTGGPLAADANVDASGAGPSFSTHICDVEVDPQTGHVTVVRYTVCQDVGRALHRAYVEGQLQGGAVQGIGWALNEECLFDDDGAMQNSSFLDYRMPVALDVPMIDTVLVEVANPNHPYGIRGVGENAIVAPLAAVTNAIHSAVGVRLRSLPMSPHKVLAAILFRKAKREAG